MKTLTIYTATENELKAVHENANNFLIVQTLEDEFCKYYEQYNKAIELNDMFSLSIIEKYLIKLNKQIKLIYKNS